MSDMKWPRQHEHSSVLNDMGKEEELDVSNHVIVLQENIKLELLC